MQTLIINTYAGSLLLGADALPGSNIIGSFEDAGFGAHLPKANRARFQNLTQDFLFADHRHQWPDDLDLTDCIVLAHPPCAAFSQQNTSKAKRGTETDAFECTRVVLKYAMNANAAAIAVESVMGALKGAWDVHERMAAAGGYYVYRVLKNSLLMGVPQFRERFWCVFVRKGLADAEMRWRLMPRIVPIATALDGIESYTPVSGLEKSFLKFVDNLTVNVCRCGVAHNFDRDQLLALTTQKILGAHRIGFSRLITPTFFPGEDPKAVCKKHVSPFTSAQPSNLAAGGYAPVLLGSSHWLYAGRVLSQESFKAIMGFPTDYIFPPDPHGMRTYLSKGVCPPVATWILANLREHLGEPIEHPLTAHGGYEKVVVPSHIVSFRVSAQDIKEYLTQMWEIGCPEGEDLLPLRDEEEALEEGRVAV